MQKPFLKWAGSKYRLPPHLLPLIGSPLKYCEPFGGSLSVALNTPAREIRVNDVNKDLVSLYGNLIKESYNELITSTSKLFTPENNQREVYNALRDKFNSLPTCEEKSSLFIYLNRHCFNGLTRYNRSGKFNVPFGRYSSPYFPEAELRGFHDSLVGKSAVKVSSLSFEDEDLYEGMGEGSVVFFDPPYVPLSATSNFTSYSCDGFNHDQQVCLVDLAKDLSSKGVKAIITNSDCEVTRGLYAEAELKSVMVSRTISANTGNRGKVSELVAVFNPR